ncbi:MAG: cell division protein FtsA [Pseudomonadota bacterium]
MTAPFNPGHFNVLKPLSTRRSTLLTVIDVGSTKIVCLIARLRPQAADAALSGRTHAIEILGIGHQRSRGIKAGVVVDIDAAERAVRLAVDTAERKAGMTVESLLVNMSGGRLASEIFSAHIGLEGRTVGDGDLERLLRAGCQHASRENRQIIHAIPIGYRLDGNQGVAIPRGMVGSRLGIDLHTVTVDHAPLQNLGLCLDRCHLDVDAAIASAYASGLASLVDDEAELGAVCIDIGGGTTNLAVFSAGRLVHVDALAMGGQLQTNAIAQGLSTSLRNAERLKTLYASVVVGDLDNEDIITVESPEDGSDDTPMQVTRAAINGLIAPSVTEILETTRDRLNASGFAARAGQRIVLTGGASQLTGLSDAASQIFGRNVRIGRPLGVKGLPDKAKGPAFSTAIGLLIYPQLAHLEYLDTHTGTQKRSGSGGYLARVGQWIRESF